MLKVIRRVQKEKRPKRHGQKTKKRLEKGLEKELRKLEAERSEINKKTYSRAVEPMSELPLRYTKTLRIGLRLADEIRKVGRK